MLTALYKNTELYDHTERMDLFLKVLHKVPVQGHAIIRAKKAHTFEETVIHVNLISLKFITFLLALFECSTPLTVSSGTNIRIKARKPQTH